MSPTRDVAALEAFLTDHGHLPPVDETGVRPLGDGNANETLLLTWGDDEYVVRLPPEVDVAPHLLNDLLGEHEVLAALESTAVPTPTVVAACEDTSVLGREFYVMERVEGDVMGEAELSRLADADQRRAVGVEAIDALAALHEVDRREIGLADVGADDGSITSLIDRLADQLAWATDRTEAARRDADRVHGQLAETEAWLRANVPAPKESTLVHGDYKLDNLLWAPGTPLELAAVLDWEMASVGDPRTDLGWFLAFWYEARDPDPLTETIRETYADHAYVDLLEVFVYEYSHFMEHEDYPTRRDLATRYEDVTGIAFTDDRFFRTLGVYKLAAILESFYRTYLEHPEHAKATYPAMELLVPTLAVSARRLAEGDVPL